MSVLIRTLRVPVFPDEKTKEQIEKTFDEYSKAAQVAYDYANANNTKKGVDSFPRKIVIEVILPVSPVV